jgi:hypothetical protein
MLVIALAALGNTAGWAAGLAMLVFLVGVALTAYGVFLSTLESHPRTALVVGSDALKAELEAAGIRAMDASLEIDDQPDVVVVSLDRRFTYGKLARAQGAVLRGAPLVATNRDPQVPGAQGRLWLGHFHDPSVWGVPLRVGGGGRGCAVLARRGVCGT